MLEFCCPGATTASHRRSARWYCLCCNDRPLLGCTTAVKLAITAAEGLYVQIKLSSRFLENQAEPFLHCTTQSLRCTCQHSYWQSSVSNIHTEWALATTRALLVKVDLDKLVQLRQHAARDCASPKLLTKSGVHYSAPLRCRASTGARYYHR